MSNVLALATVTAVLEERVRTLLNNASISLGVSTDHPTDATNTGVFIKLIRLTPHAQLRAMDVPARSSDGLLTGRPRIPLALDYLFTFMGSATDHEPERLAGLVITDLHARPIISRAEIQAFLSGLAPSHWLRASDLAESVETVRLTPASLELSELNNVWSLLNQSFFGLSMVYQASAVWLDDAVVAREVLPVREPIVRVRPAVFPQILRLVAGGRTLPIWEEGEVATIEGTGLRGETTWLRIGTRLFRVPEPDARNDRISFTWDPALNLLSGITPLQVVHRADYGYGTPDTFRTAAESNSIGVQLTPRVTVPAGAVTVNGSNHDVELIVRPPPDPDQNISVLFDRAGGTEHVSSTEVSIAGDRATFTVSGLIAGDWLVRVRIDGAVSRLTNAPSGDFNGPVVTVP